MAKKEKVLKPKGKGLFSQFREQVKFLKEVDPKAMPLGIFFGVLIFLVILVLGSIISGFAFLGIVIWAILAIVTGYLTLLLTMTRRANSAIFKKYENEPGRISITVGTLTRRRWKGNNQPVAVNPRTKDMVFRIVGPAGVVLMAEGAKTSAKAMLEEERRKVQRLATGVTVHTFYSAQDGEGVPLGQLHKKISKLKRSLNRAEIAAVQNRLASIDSRSGLPIPKGIDPMKMRASRRIQ
ncbi:MAG: DUF4191 family protein [Rhodoluna sp.]|nr:DUF4191 family protein [Rhodoluna sp.]